MTPELKMASSINFYNYSIIIDCIILIVHNIFILVNDLISVDYLCFHPFITALKCIVLLHIYIYIYIV